ncbi:MAG: methanogenesis marker 2 protein [Thermoplasmatales archaeon]|nr:methanogenesis marker 2 protein [Thermoplasmatales archaeon]
MDLDGAVNAIRTFPGVTRKRTIREIVRFLPTDSFSTVAASEGEDAAAIEFGDDYILFAADGIMEALVKSDPFFAGYFSVLVNVNDIAAMGGKSLAMVDVMSIKDDEVCAQILKGLEAAVKKFNVPVVGGHTHPDCGYQAIDVSIIGSVPKTDIIRSDMAETGNDIVFAMDLDGHFPVSLPYAWETTFSKDDDYVQKQMALLPKIASEHLATAAKDMSNPGCIGTLGMLLEASGKGGYVDMNRIPVPEGADFMQWILAYQGYGFVVTCRPENSRRLISLFESVGVAAAVVGSIEDGSRLRLVSGEEERVLFDFSKDMITGCRPRCKR